MDGCRQTCRLLLAAAVGGLLLGAMTASSNSQSRNDLQLEQRIDRYMRIPSVADESRPRSTNDGSKSKSERKAAPHKSKQKIEPPR